MSIKQETKDLIAGLVGLALMGLVLWAAFVFGPFGVSTFWRLFWFSVWYMLTWTSFGIGVIVTLTLFERYD